MIQSAARAASTQGGCSSSRLDHGLKFYIIHGGCASSRPNGEFWDSGAVSVNSNLTVDGAAYFTSQVEIGGGHGDSGDGGTTITAGGHILTDSATTFAGPVYIGGQKMPEGNKGYTYGGFADFLAWSTYIYSLSVCQKLLGSFIVSGFPVFYSFQSRLFIVFTNPFINSFQPNQAGPRRSPKSVPSPSWPFVFSFHIVFR